MDLNTSFTMDNQNTYDYINGIFMNPTMLIILVVVVAIYILFFSFLGESTSNSYSSNSSYSSNYGSQNNSTSSLTIIFIIILVVFILLTIVNGYQYFFGIDVTSYISQLFSGTPTLNLDINQTTANTGKLENVNLGNIENKDTDNVLNMIRTKQVFNIPGNNYSYDDAKSLCKAYDSRLATYDEVEKAYNNGGEWCNYGWSEGQMALFPTQKATFDNLQKIQGHEHDCGRPGVNGGYMANPAAKYGVNCYGYKPAMTEEEEREMETNPAYPRTEKDILLEKRVNYWKQNINDILVSPFNHTRWSMT